MADMNVSFDVDEIIWGMDKYEKQDMVDSLYDDGFVPTELKPEVTVWESRIPTTNLEKELSDTLNKIWDNRRFINNNDLETLKHLAKKGI